MRLEGLRIGLIEDDPIVGESLVQALELEGAETVWWQIGTDAARAAPHANLDVIVCDIQLPDMTGEDVYAEVRHYKMSAPFLFMTAYGDLEHAVRLLKMGAGDYVTKPFDMEDFFNRLITLTEAGTRFATKGALGPSDAMLEIEHMLVSISHTQMPVLLTGETGVGKEVCARFLNSLSKQEISPFMAFNCAAIPQQVIEMELFGSEKPEFHAGYAERAQSGTLFFDEIAELSLVLQPKLLRLLEDDTFFRLAGDYPVHFAARVICSTNRNLNAMLDNGAFRKDLFYRINTVSIEIPPLRHRRDDILWLAERFLVEGAALSGQEPKSLGAAAEERLLEHDWPGNARELRNRVDRAGAMAQWRYIRPEDLFPDRPQEERPAHRIRKLSEARDAAEKRQIELALKAREGNISEAARALGISRTTMWEKMLKHGIRSRTTVHVRKSER